jgi:diguanylate cyclase (GGDEF)-like protein/PAS domain S-box-containing protein
VNLSQRTLLVVFLTVIGLLVILYGASHYIVLDSFVRIEEQIIREHANRALGALKDEIDGLDSLATDWAAERAQELLEGGSPPLAATLDPNVFTRFRLNVILYYDAQGHLTLGKAYDYRHREVVTIPKGLAAPSIDPRLLHHPGGRGFSGVILLRQGPMLLSSQPIGGEAEGRRSRGTLVIGRHLDSALLEHLAGITYLSLTVRRLKDPVAPPDFRAASAGLRQSARLLVRPLDEQLVAGYALIDDAYGSPTLVLRVDMPRDIYAQAKRSLAYLLIALLLTGLTFAAVNLGLLQRMVLSRLSRLDHSLREIADSRDLSTRLAVSGADELASLGQTINEMLAALEAAEQVKESEARYRSLTERLRAAHQRLVDIVEFLPDPTFVVDAAGKVIAWNRAIEELTGVPQDGMVGKGDREYSVPLWGTPRATLVDLILEPDRSYPGPEHESLRWEGRTVFGEVFAPRLAGGRGAFLWCAASPLLAEEGTVAGAIQSLRDMSDRKRMEEQLKYLSLHDPLTGLYNRNYFEQELYRLGNTRHLPVGLIVCDVDGLKLINDSLGHTVGDDLLRTAAGLVRECFRTSDMVARIGGDEFAVLLPEGDQKALEAACYRVRQALEAYNERNPELPLSISIGYASTAASHGTVADLFKQADNAMYREKLHRGQSTRSAIVKTLQRALEARDYITEGHADRLQHLVAAVGAELGLGEPQIADLRLLAQFHDIGKVGIPDSILHKPGPLTPDEMREMRQHCEIGYRIAQASPDLAAIADWILKHHEWWNGQGYPLGLAGEDVPLECRLLTIADAYDAMTSDRPYRKALSPEAALAELRRCAGVQFDPRLVLLFAAVVQRDSSPGRTRVEATPA